MLNTLQAGFQISTYLGFSKNIGLRQKQCSHQFGIAGIPADHRHFGSEHID